jgi:SAM-dependent methyltransferase
VRWQLRCVLDNLKAILPLQKQLRAYKRLAWGYEPDTKHQPGALADGYKQIRWLQRQNRTIAGSVVLEIGTGWEPIIPLIYILAGAKLVYLADSTRLICKQSLDATLDFLISSKDDICKNLQITGSTFDEVLAKGRDGRDLETQLKALNLIYLAPCDCRRLGMEDGCLDYIYSRAVLEHVPQVVIHDIFREAKRLLRPTGLMCHFVDTSDHWEHRDKTISRVHFLQHSERVMAFTCVNSQNYQNRLRHQEYVDMLHEVGFSVLRAEADIDERSLRLLPNLSLQPRFKVMPLEDLATISSYLLAVPE